MCVFVADINDTIMLVNNLTIDITPHSGGHYIPLHFDKYVEIRVSTSGGRLRLYNFYYFTILIKIKIKYIMHCFLKTRGGVQNRAAHIFGIGTTCGCVFRASLRPLPEGNELLSLFKSRWEILPSCACKRSLIFHLYSILSGVNLDNNYRHTIGLKVMA